MRRRRIKTELKATIPAYTRRYGDEEYITVLRSRRSDNPLFLMGALNVSGFTRYVLKKNARTDHPVQWFLSVEENGPEVTLVDLHQLDGCCGLAHNHIGREPMARLGAKTKADLRTYAVVTVPRNIRRISMNVKAPILIYPKTRSGLQSQNPDIKTSTMRRLIYWELTGDMTDRKKGQLALFIPNEISQIDNDIVIKVIALEDGGIRLGISAARGLKISRGDNNVAPDKQMAESRTTHRCEGLGAMLHAHDGEFIDGAV